MAMTDNEKILEVIRMSVKLHGEIMALYYLQPDFNSDTSRELIRLARETDAIGNVAAFGKREI